MLCFPGHIDVARSVRQDELLATAPEGGKNEISSVGGMALVCKR